MTRHKIFTPVLIAGCVVLILNFGIRASFGVFQIPIATEFGWPRADFSMAIAIQNLAWGIGQPIFGALAERFGDRKAIIAGRFYMRRASWRRAMPQRPVRCSFWKSLSALASPAPALA